MSGNLTLVHVAATHAKWDYPRFELIRPAPQIPTFVPSSTSTLTTSRLTCSSSAYLLIDRGM